MLPKMTGYVTYFDEGYFFFSRRWKIVKKHSKVWDKISNIKQKGSNSKLVYIEKQLKTEIKTKIFNKNFHDNEIPKEGSHCVCFQYY